MSRTGNQGDSMSEQPGWMPEPDELLDVLFECGVRGAVDIAPLRAKVTAVVEKALAADPKERLLDGLKVIQEYERKLAEQEARWISALREVNGKKVCHPDFREMWAKAESSPLYWAELLRLSMEALREQEARHKREVIEARICGIQAVAEIIPTGLHSYSIAKRWIAALRAELAALDKEPDHE